MKTHLVLALIGSTVTFAIHISSQVSVERFIILRGQRSYLLGYLWIDRVFLLGTAGT
jgi:hypothetical protein